MVTPPACITFSRSNSLSMPDGDSTAVGSSRISTLASVTSARAISTACWVSTGRSRIRSRGLTLTPSASRCRAQRRSSSRRVKMPRPLVGAELHRLGDGEGRRQREALVDEFDAGGARGADIADRDLPAADDEAAPDRLDDAGRDAGEGGLAGAVLADDGMDHPRREADRDVDQSLDVPVLDGDAPAFDRVGLGRHPRRGR